jgi:TRAP-type mannitol/chloroaromatic compound transport system substrate-binding protein
MKSRCSIDRTGQEGRTQEETLLREKGRTWFVAGLLLFGLAALPGSAAEPVTLVMPVAYGTHLPGLGDSAEQLVKLVADRSQGSLKIDLKEPGDGTQPQEILEKVSSGKVDAGFATPSLWAAKLPAASLFAGFPFGPDGKTYIAWLSAGHGRKLYQDMYDQAGFAVHVVPCAFGGGEASGWFVKEIKSTDDIKGLRMRIFGLGARVMSKLGATTVLVPGGSLGSAFDSKEIDAAEFLTPAIDLKQGLQDHVKLLYVPGWHQPQTLLELLINRDRWKALGPERQGLIETACKDLLASTLVASAELQQQALAELTAKGVRIETWSGDLPKAFRDAWKEVAKEESDRDINFRIVLTDLENFRAQKRASAAAPAELPALPPMPSNAGATPPKAP